MGFYQITKEDRDIDNVLNWAFEAEQAGTAFSGMTYEQGIIAMFDWLTGATEDRPDTE